MQETSFAWQTGMTPEGLSGLSLGIAATILPAVATAAAQYEKFGGIAFEHVLEQPLAQKLRTLCAEGTFLSDQSDPGHREVESPQKAGRILGLILSRPEVLRWLEDVTGCGPLRETVGRVVRTFPRPGDELHWHDDLNTEIRRLALVINLGTEPFEGGEFELRHKHGNLRLQHQHKTSDSMLVFRVSSGLEHRVLPLRSGGPRLVFTGWALGASL